MCFFHIADLLNRKKTDVTIQYIGLIPLPDQMDPDVSSPLIPELYHDLYFLKLG
jgi:hypothetical protein